MNIVVLVTGTLVVVELYAKVLVVVVAKGSFKEVVVDDAVISPGIVVGTYFPPDNLFLPPFVGRPTLMCPEIKRPGPITVSFADPFKLLFLFAGTLHPRRESVLDIASSWSGSADASPGRIPFAEYPVWDVVGDVNRPLMLIIKRKQTTDKKMIMAVTTHLPNVCLPFDIKDIRELFVPLFHDKIRECGHYH